MMVMVVMAMVMIVHGDGDDDVDDGDRRTKRVRKTRRTKRRRKTKRTRRVRKTTNATMATQTTTRRRMGTSRQFFLPAFIMNTVKSACFKSAAMPRYRGSSGIASATADLLASPIGDENRQRPLPRMPNTRVPSTRLPLPRIQETPLPRIYLFRCFCHAPAPLLRCCFVEDRRFEPNPFTEMKPFTV